MGAAALAEMTWVAAEERLAGAVLLVPVGATEQHGPHLPLSTDTDIAVALADVVASMSRRAVVAPAVAFGSSGEHEAFPGTISVGRAALEAALVELCRSASRWFRRCILVSTHGGNARPVADAVNRLGEESRDVVAWSPSWGGDAHAGRTETSIMLALRPEAVDLRSARAGNTASMVALMPTLRFGGVRPVSPNGVLGDPAGASAEEGRELLRAAAAELRAIVEDM